MDRCIEGLIEAGADANVEGVMGIGSASSYRMELARQ